MLSSKLEILREKRYMFVLLFTLQALITSAMSTRLQVTTVTSSNIRMGAKISIPNGSSTIVVTSVVAVLLSSNEGLVVAKLIVELSIFVM